MNILSNIQEDIKTLDVNSTAFEHRNYIPIKYTYDGKNINPPLTIHKIPEKTKSLVLIVEDTNAPVRTWVHWLVWNIPPKKKIEENNIPGVEGRNDFKTRKYIGPCPLSGLHYYHFRVYALNTLLDPTPGFTKHEIEKMMSAHILGYGELIGLYRNNEQNQYIQNLNAGTDEN